VSDMAWGSQYIFILPPFVILLLNYLDIDDYNTKRKIKQ